MYVRMHLKMSYSVDIDKLSPYSSLGTFHSCFSVRPISSKISDFRDRSSEIFCIFAVVE